MGKIVNYLASENPNLRRFVTREAQKKMLRLHKGRKTGDGKQETENTDGKQEARSAESIFDIFNGSIGIRLHQGGVPGGRLGTIERAV